MTECMNNRRITVLGAGESGLQSALFLKSRGANVFISEMKEGSQWDPIKTELDHFGISYEFGHHRWDKIETSDLIIISPGIPPKALIYQKLICSNLPIWSEIELAYRFCAGEVIAVTGTSGKTTVTTLIREVLARAGHKVLSCGNIGNSFVREVDKIDSDTIVVLEVSSFQLRHVDQFKPHVAILLNVSDNHLDWHSSREEYRAAKWRIFKNQSASDYAVIHAQDVESVNRAKTLSSQVIYFDEGEEKNPNFSAVEQVASLYGVKRRVIYSALKEFKGLEHRLEEIGIEHGIRYINDSKSTTVASLEWALKQIQAPVVLIAGGRYKGGDFESLRQLVQKKVKFLIVIGEAKELIRNAFEDLVTVYPAATLEEAVRIARGAARAGEAVLFSPACSSFDMFASYADRGQKFKRMVHAWHDELAVPQSL